MSGTHDMGIDGSTYEYSDFEKLLAVTSELRAILDMNPTKREMVKRIEALLAQVQASYAASGSIDL